MKIRFPKIPMKWVWFVGLLLVAVVGLATWNRWFPAATAWVDSTVTAFRGGVETSSDDGHVEDDPHAGHDHGAHAGHSDETSLELSAQALRNIGLSDETIQPVKLETFRRSITVPAVVVERPGRTRVQVATPMTGVITHVHAVQGEAVEPGTLLFQIRLTHEDLVNAQTEFVKTLGELEVEEREIKRLQGVTQSGAVAGKLLLDREYARDKLTALLRAQREALKLHGLSEAQVDQIASERRLLRELQIFAPSIDSHGNDELKLTRRFISQASYQQPIEQPNAERPHSGPLTLQQLDVHKGQSVAAGETLCILADYDELFIEGMAFEQDVSQLRQTSDKEWTVDAIFRQPGDEIQVVEGLKIAYLANTVDPASRTLHFYVRLPNEVAKDRREDGNRYVEWKYLPGQRLQLRVPVEEWPDQIVLPVDAVAREGAESFVFQQNGDHFDRVPVHVKYRDQYSAVIENDGSLFSGDVVALRGAHQMQMALKNKAGGGVDPHAGHNH
ncbi:efflux RND transporter periplasmic adaptor subunit [Roseiconus lacunae]|uniref:Efflux RND transporter periplasmic adaptor subunit n=1 Tax=Roseiconus lacunae TaxID=2605694 RepID=A0ABT7PFT8_9BACT|nr:efflux RND transporter periplasmic adaptor subunit [Roseiconus lacunae]MDM4015101.1 efflux RND transporter periplasmic adaptor subunit [Roseiconus lacunae]